MPNFAPMKRLILLILILIAAIGSYFLLKKDLNHTSDIGTADFAIPENLKIDKIFYASKDKDAGFLTFTKENGIWWVDNGKLKLKADSSSLNDLVSYILPKMQVQSPVNDAALDQVNRFLAIKGVKAQFYAGSKLIKTFYVGDRTADDLGTYMYLPETTRPCIVKIPGHNGYLTPFFNTDINNWRTLALLDIPAAEMKSVKINWATEPNQDFTITRTADGPEMSKNGGSKVPANRNRMLAYLDMFEGITREAGEIAGVNKTAQKDSILQSVPYWSVTVTKTNGKVEKLNIYRRKVSSETYSPENRAGELKVYEIETYWGSIEGSNEIWVIQDAILKNRMKKISDFIP